MRNILFYFLLFSSTILYGQIMPQSIILNSEKSSDNEVINDILDLENIDYYRFTFSGEELIDKQYVLTVKELWNGEITMFDTIMNSSKYNDLLKIKDDTFQIKVIAKKLADDRLKVVFTFPRVKNTKYYKSVSSDDYSLRNLNNNKDFEIKLRETFNFLAYILPYEKDGAKYWCTLDKSGEDVESWGKKFGLEHYLIYEMKFE